MYCEHTENCTDSPLNLQKIITIFNNNTEKTLILVFSSPNCAPCKQLAKSLQSIYDELIDEKKKVPNIIKYSAELLCDDDINYISKFPTILIIKSNQIKDIDMNKSLLCQLNNNNDIIKIIGLPRQSFYDENNLTIDF